MKWLSVRLESLISMHGGGTPSKQNPSFWNGDIPWVSPKDMGVRDIHDSQDHITQEAVEKSTTQVVPAGSILVVVRSGILVRKVPIAIAQRPLAINQDMKALVPNQDVLDARFLSYLLESKQQALLAGYVKRGATVHSLQVDKLRKMIVQLPPMSEQHRIVEILDEAATISQRRVEADAKTDRILPALFHKMFGDPVANPKGWPIQRLGRVLSSIDGGWSPRCLDRPAEADEWGVLKLGAVTWCRYNDLEQKALPPDIEPKPELEVRAGDILFSRKNTRELVAACALINNTRSRLLMSDLIFRLRSADESILRPEYLAVLLGHTRKRLQVQQLATGVAGSMPNISRGRLKTIEIAIPPAQLQNEFAAHYTVTSKVDELRKAGREESERLYGAVLRLAFTGDLTAKWREGHMKEILSEMEEQAKVLKTSEHNTN